MILFASTNSFVVEPLLNAVESDGIILEFDFVDEQFGCSLQTVQIPRAKVTYETKPQSITMLTL